MTKLLLHIGHHKTGSSAIQVFLSKNRLELEKHKILYPLTGTDGKVAHHSIRGILESGEYNEIQSFKRTLTKESRAYELIVISSENLARLKNPQALIDILDFAEEIETILYVREPISYLISAYRQYIQAKTEFITFNEYFKNRKLKYLELVNRWRSVTPNLQVGFYDRSRLDQADITSDFVLRTKLPVRSTQAYEINTSLSGALLVLKLFLNHSLDASHNVDFLYTLLEKESVLLGGAHHDICLSRKTKHQIFQFCVDDYEFLGQSFAYRPNLENSNCRELHIFSREYLQHSLQNCISIISNLLDLRLEVVGSFDFSKFDELNSEELQSRLHSCLRIY
jgi:hypothetical protein